MDSEGPGKDDARLHLLLVYALVDRSFAGRSTADCYDGFEHIVYHFRSFASTNLLDLGKLRVRVLVGVYFELLVSAGVLGQCKQVFSWRS
jgi:hypothetical protein